MPQQKPRLAHDELMRDEEVLRATKELAAYFKGRRTEREARAALKIIKAYIRSREQLDPKHRPPLAGLHRPSAPVRSSARKPAKPRARRRKPAAAAPPEPVAVPPVE